MNMPSIESRTLLKFGEAVGFRENGPEKAGNAQKRAVVLDPNVGIGQRDIQVGTDDTPGLFYRTDANTSQPRLQFLKGVLDEFGIQYPADATVNVLKEKATAKNGLPKSVLNVMKLEDYGTFFRHPLSDYRVTTVLHAVANEKAKMAKEVTDAALKEAEGLRDAPKSQDPIDIPKQVVQPLDGGTKSLVLNDLKDQEKIFEYGSVLNDAIGMTELKWDGNDMTAFEKWLDTRAAESACKESQATDIPDFIADLVLNFAASRKSQSPVNGLAKDSIPEQVVQKPVEKAKSEEEVQIENLAKPGSVPPNNEPLGDKKCGEENGDRRMLEYSIFDSKTNTTQKFFTYPQLGGTGNHCFFLSALRHLNITPSSENAQTLRKTMGEAFQQLKEALEPQLWDVREELGRQAQAWKIERLDLRKERKTASNERRLDIDDRLRKIDEELKSLKDQVIGISKQLGEVDRKPAGNPLAANCPVKYSGCRPEGCTFNIPREDDPDPYELVELFDAELNSDAKVFGLESRKMADLAHAALLPQILKRPVIVVSVDLDGKLIDGVRDGGVTKFTKNALTGEDYKDKDPVYIRFQKHFKSPGDNGHFEAMVPVPDGKAQGQDQQNDLNSLLGVDRVKKETGFLTQQYLKKEVKRAFDDKLPSDGWEKHLKLQELNQALGAKGAEVDKLRLELEKKLDEVATEIDNGNKPVKQLEDDLHTWLCGFRDRALALI